MNRFPRILLAQTAAFLCLSPGAAFSQAITEMREWTNADGKKIQAELLEFGVEREDGLVRLRMKGGSVFKVAPETLSREDQAIILERRFGQLFRSRYSERMEAHFFYSKKIPAGEQADRTVAYIGNDLEGGWVRLKASLKSGVANSGVAFLIVGQGAEPVRIPFDQDDVEFDRGRASLDISLTRHAESIATLLQNPAKLRLVVENDAGIFTAIDLSPPEIAALREVFDAYGTLAGLTTDHTWWTTFQGIDPAEFTALLRARENPPPPPGGPSMEDGNGEPLVASQDWFVSETGEVIAAAVTGFDRNRVVLQPAEGNARRIPLEALSPGNRSLLAEKRLEHSLLPTWHPYDESFAWHWPRNWTEPENRITRRVFLFVIHRETGEPGLVLQQRFDDAEGSPASGISITGKAVDLDLDFPVGKTALKLRSNTHTKYWLPVSGEFARVLTVASPALEGLQFEIRSPSAETQGGEFTAEEFAASIEAIEIYRAWKTMADDRDAPLDPFSEPPAPAAPAPDTASEPAKPSGSAPAAEKPPVNPSP